MDSGVGFPARLYYKVRIDRDVDFGVVAKVD